MIRQTKSRRRRYCVFETRCDETMTDIASWLRQHCAKDFAFYDDPLLFYDGVTIHYAKVGFKSDDDALLFVMAWDGRL